MEAYLRILVLIILFFVGAILGSFSCCQAWRIRLKEQNKKSPGKWSVCLSCGKRLKKSENIPIISWLAQKGKCRSCGAKIGLSEILSEFSFALALPLVANALYDRFVFFITNRQISDLVVLSLMSFVLIISMCIMWILIIYDAKWQKLPTFLLTILNICAVICVALSSIGILLGGGELPDVGTYLLRAAGSAALLAGPYFLLSAFSKEKLVGSGDWLVALPIALLLGHWWLALVALFIANAIGSVFGISIRIKKGARQIPFGPFLVFAFVVVFATQSLLLPLVAAL